MAVSFCTSLSLQDGEDVIFYYDCLLVAGPPHNVVVIKVNQWCGVTDGQSNQLFPFPSKAVSGSSKQPALHIVTLLCQKMFLQRKIVFFFWLGVCIKDQTADISTNA